MGFMMKIRGSFDLVIISVIHSYDGTLCRGYREVAAKGCFLCASQAWSASWDLPLDGLLITLVPQRMNY